MQSSCVDDVMSMLIPYVTCVVRNIKILNLYKVCGLLLCTSRGDRGGADNFYLILFLSFAVGVGLVFNILSCTLAGVIMASALHVFQVQALL